MEYAGTLVLDPELTIMRSITTMIHNPAEFLELRPVGISSTVELTRALVKAIWSRERSLWRFLRKPVMVRILDAIFIARPNTADIYAIWSEQYELKKWFLPLVEGTVVDVGAHIGKYVVHACKSEKVRRVIGIEPLIHNYIGINVEAEPLDEMLRLNIDRVDFLKVDIEGYVLESLLGMERTLKNTSWLMIESSRKDLLAHRLLKQHGFKLVDVHGRNCLYKRHV